MAPIDRSKAMKRLAFWHRQATQARRVKHWRGPSIAECEAHINRLLTCLNAGFTAADLHRVQQADARRKAP